MVLAFGAFELLRRGRHLAFHVDRNADAQRDRLSRTSMVTGQPKRIFCFRPRIPVDSGRAC